MRFGLFVYVNILEDKNVKITLCTYFVDKTKCLDNDIYGAALYKYPTNENFSTKNARKHSVQSGQKTYRNVYCVNSHHVF